MTEQNKNYDLVIVGGGPAGLTASIYATRRKLKTLLVAMAPGGQMAIAHEIENYPALPKTSGAEIADKMKKQAESFGTEFAFNEVTAINKNGDLFEVKTNLESYNTKSVILAFGLTPRTLDVPGEEKFKGRGVSYCATCDGPFFKNKIVGVVGGGNSAVEAAVYLAKIASEVHLIHHGEEFKAESYLLEQAKSDKKIIFNCCFNISEIKGDKKVEAIMLTDEKDSTKSQELKLDGLFVEIGYLPKTGWLKGTVDLNERGEIIIDKENQTSIPGIFAAGDCTDIGLKQVVIAAGEGAQAALRAYKYISAKTGGKATPDWGTH